MSSSHTNNICLLKDNLRDIRSHIEELQHILSSNCASDICSNNDLLLNTSALLEQVEQMPLSKIAKKIQKNKVQRQKKAKKRAILKKQFNAKQKTFQHNFQQRKEKETKTAATSKPHVQLRQQYDARRFLTRFELLTQLHAARAANSRATKAFSNELQTLKAIWTQVLQQSLPRHVNIKSAEQQWEEIMYGAVEQTYLDVTPRKKELKRIRTIWNSYYTRSIRRGSYIPSNPLLPPAEINELWRSYLQQTK